jgi:hypothetical protein
MSEPVEHEMTLESIHESGMEEWACPTCGRRFLVRWTPNYIRLILEPGDERVIHTGTASTRQTEAPAVPVDDPRLAPFAAFLGRLLGE